ncbi:MAG TPA: hypothetical protein VHY75_10880 [Steroidobacteraceae bacterium]|jgi:hypothetical protein|nr:hypothetical protein [Steroidobacteraceae bacterium]
MQEAFLGGWARQASFSVEVLAPLYDLNLRFLDLLASRGARRIRGSEDLPAGTWERVAPMSAPQRAAAAQCPYALFDLRFNDETHWKARLCGAGQWRIADESAEDGASQDAANFVRLALFYAWHVASTGRHAVRLLLGMSELTAGAFRASTLACLPSLVASETANLTARFCNCGVYWSALMSAAARRDAHRLRKVQLFGLQLAAASLLPSEQSH